MPSCHSCGILSWLLLKYSNVQLSLHWTKEYALAVRQHIIATQWPCLIPHPVCLHRSMEIEEVICSIQTHSSFLAICVSHAVKQCFIGQCAKAWRNCHCYAFLHWTPKAIVTILFTCWFVPFCLTHSWSAWNAACLVSEEVELHYCASHVRSCQSCSKLE